jgi:hypothetical protein
MASFGWFSAFSKAGFKVLQMDTHQQLGSGTFFFDKITILYKSIFHEIDIAYNFFGRAS